jgi:uncharacterized membrane protein (UPF0136 family)
MMNTYPLLAFARIYFLFAGLVMISGGVVGYTKAKSVASLVAGGVSGLLLLLSAFLLVGHLEAGLVIALLVCLALAGRFTPALVRGKMMPAVYVAPLSLGGVVLALWLLLHMAGPGAP